MPNRKKNLPKWRSFFDKNANSTTEHIKIQKSFCLSHFSKVISKKWCLSTKNGLQNHESIVRHQSRISVHAIFIFPYPEKKQLFFRNSILSQFSEKLVEKGFG